MKQEELIREENRRIRLLRLSTDLCIQTVLAGGVTAQEAFRMIRGLRAFAEKLFPGKGDVFDLVYLPRFRRALREAGMANPESESLFQGVRSGDS